METLTCICNLVHFAGIIHAKERQIFLLVSYVKSLQNIAQTSAKGLNANINLPLQYRPFSRYNPCKRQANVLCIFPNQNTCKIQLNLVQKIVHSTVYLPLQSSSFPGVINAPNSQVFQHIITIITFRIRAALPAKRMQLRIRIPLKCCSSCRYTSSKL